MQWFRSLGAPTFAFVWAFISGAGDPVDQTPSFAEGGGEF